MVEKDANLVTNAWSLMSLGDINNVMFFIENDDGWNPGKLEYNHEESLHFCAEPNGPNHGLLSRDVMLGNLSIEATTGRIKVS